MYDLILFQNNTTFKKFHIKSNFFHDHERQGKIALSLSLILIGAHWRKITSALENFSLLLAWKNSSV